MMIDTNPDPFQVFGDSDERFHVQGGNDLVPRALAEALEGRIELGHELEAVARESGRLPAHLPRTTAWRSRPSASSCAPFSALRGTDRRRAAGVKRKRSPSSATARTPLMVASERLWRSAGGSNGSVLSDLPFQLTWEATRLQHGSAGIVVAFGGGRRGRQLGLGTVESLAEEFGRDFERLFPGIAALRIGELRFHWPSFNWTRGSYAYRPGQ
jgi:monoamine oxidase